LDFVNDVSADTKRIRPAFKTACYFSEIVRLWNRVIIQKRNDFSLGSSDSVIALTCEPTISGRDTVILDSLIARLVANYSGDFFRFLIERSVYNQYVVW
jgi:hypothetical protein